MILSDRWRRLDAPSWVYRLCMLYAVLAGVATVVALFPALVMGAPWIPLIPLAFACFHRWLARAWDDERRWAWVVLAALSGVGGGVGLLSLAVGGPSFWTAVYLLLDAAMLVLLVHPDSRDVLDPPPAIRVGDPRDTTGAGW